MIFHIALRLHLEINGFCGKQNMEMGKTIQGWLVTLGLALLVLVTIAVAVGYLVTRGAAGPVARSLHSVPAEYGLKAEVISFASVDGIELKGWWIPAQGPRFAREAIGRGTVILAHGNGGNRSSMRARATFLATNGYNAFPLDLRAHGESGGRFMTPGNLEALDILGALEAAKRRGQAGPFVALGHSYGARASLWAAARSHEVAAVIVDGGFISVYDTLKRQVARMENDPNASFGAKTGLRVANSLSKLSWARTFMEWAYYRRTGFRFHAEDDNALRVVSQIGERPIPFIAGERDPIAPPEDARRTYETVQSSIKAILVVAGADHNSTFKADPDLYKAKVLDFLDAALGPGAHRNAPSLP